MTHRFSPNEFTLSVVVPCYNEYSTIRTVLERVRVAWPPRKQVIVIDDASSDGTGDLLRGDLADLIDVMIHHPVNRGKGAALRSGFAAATGEIVIVQDGDLEYDPQDWRALLRPYFETEADVVYGSRFLSGPRYRYANSYWHRTANAILTYLSNVATDLSLTDAHTCYKSFRRSALDGLRFEEDRFAICPEMTAKFAAKGLNFYEVPISYARRSYAEGKKIGLKDAFRAVYAIAKYGVLRR